ncbi:MAG: hypothetical protein R2795_16660 [Saprospiraceae bacterium]
MNDKIPSSILALMDELTDLYLFSPRIPESPLKHQVDYPKLLLFHKKMLEKKRKEKKRKEKKRKESFFIIKNLRVKKLREKKAFTLQI